MDSYRGNVTNQIHSVSRFRLPLLVVILALAFVAGTEPAHQSAVANSSDAQLLCPSAIAGKTDRDRSPGPEVLQFRFGAHRTELLSVDPTLTWNTFLGGFGIDEGASALALDSSGNVYVAGSGNAPWGSPVRAYSGDDDAFVAKLDSNGNLVWNTFIGGAQSDLATALAVDASGNIYVVGWSSSSWGSPIRSFSGGYDAFAAKIDSGGHLIWNTFLGGPGINSGFDYGRAVAVDGSGNVYVAGQSAATWGSPLRAYGGGDDGFVVKLDSNGSLIWNTFLGGGLDDEVFALTVDANRNVYVAGGSNGGWGPSANPYSGYYDAFVAKLDSSGSLVWNSFLGSSDYDFGYALALDPSGNVYIAGYSHLTWGSPVRPLSTGGWDAFAAKLDPIGKLVWNTFLGGSGFDFGSGMAIDSDRNLYIAGLSDGTWGSPMRAFTGSFEDAFAAKLDANGQLVWNTFLGGNKQDQANAVAIDASGNVYVAGDSAATWGSPVRAFTGSSDSFVAKVPPPAQVQFSSSAYSVGEGDGRVTITLTRGGDTTSSASVNYATNDSAGLTNCAVINHIASPRCDFINTLGAMSFAAGETSKTFTVAIVDDAYAEGDETFTIGLNTPSGAGLGEQSTATVTIHDNDAVNGPNPIDNTNFFVRQQYIDFLGREPDSFGFAGWIGTINNCATDHPGHPELCDRIHVSQQFFQSQEFQERGYFVYRFYNVAFGRKPDYTEFVPDLASVSGFLDATQLEAAKVAFINAFMARPAFVSAYNSLTNQQYVDMLLNTANAGISAATRQTMIDGLNNSTMTRAAVLRQIVESPEVAAKYNHQAYAVMEYFGYLRRQPDALYLNWISVLDSTNDPRGMVDGFVTSTEYRQRFGP